MSKRYIMGNEALAYASLVAGVDFVSGYPGTPSSEVIDTLRVIKPRDCHIEWSVNEKVAFENALAASWCGQRALVTMKHVGLNVAADPLMTAAYTGAKGGFVVLVADDPGAHSSQNEQDSRCFAKFAKIPCLDPAGVQEAHDMMVDAFRLSEELSLPVILRPTTRICHQKSDVELGNPENPEGGHRKGRFQKDPRQYVVIPAHSRLLHKRLNEKQTEIVEKVAASGYNRYHLEGPHGVIASGIAAAYVEEILPPGVSFMKVQAYPVDQEQIRSFVGRHMKVLVVEELEPVLEEQARQADSRIEIHGKLDGFIPREGELSIDLVDKAFGMAGIGSQSPPADMIKKPEEVPMRPSIMCAGCAHRPLFYMIRKVFREGVYPSDIGCYTLGLQMGAVDTCLCMGASISVATGMYHAGEERPIVCTVGDSTFLHAGIPPLINAVYNGASIVVVILDNRTTAMTGHQPHAASGYTTGGEPCIPVSIEAICRASGVASVETVDPYDIHSLQQSLERAKELQGVRVIISRQLCVINARRAGVKRGRYMVSPEDCTGCGVCVRFGCPAIEKNGDMAEINELCSGCGVCAQLCPSAAIRRGR
ncbi:MAG: indolepyruvate ferredoxin oxidoreductase subunit alpha [Methanomicrobiales archaeon]|nr:indolepyruvate ferredoxin oxidoreductase subunit alpha [Methanomicrobiales archaeon]